MTRSWFEGGSLREGKDEGAEVTVFKVEHKRTSLGYKSIKYCPYIGQYLRAGNQDGNTWSEGQGYEGVSLLVSSDMSGARVRVQGSHQGSMEM